MDYIFENFETQIEVVESSPKKLSEGVLSRVRGPSFFLDGFSRNGRFYPAELWENALKNPETKRSLERGLMFGCIGHPKDYTLDELLESGKVSHKVVDIKIDKNSKQGIAEYEILDTPAGRILDAVLKSGSKLYVSTRAFGSFKNEDKIKDGKKFKVLDPNNFVLESIDFVIQPGFLETNPQLVESIREDFELMQEDPYQIECEDGICGLNLPQINEDKKEEEQDVSDTPEPEENKNGEQIVDDKELEKTIESLSLEELKVVTLNIIKENKILSEQLAQEKNEDNGEVEVDAKLFTNYINLVNLLTKMVRYDVDYEKYYDKLIEFLDKDDKLTQKDTESINTIVDEILKEKDLDESMGTLCNKIKELQQKMFNTAEKPDPEEKEGEKEDTSTEIKPDETKEHLTSSEIFFKILSGELNELVNVKALSEELEQKLQEARAQISKDQQKIISMKEATKVILSQLEEKKEEIDKIQEKANESVSESVIEEYEKELNALKEERESLIDKHTELLSELKEKEEKIQTLENKNDALVIMLEELKEKTSDVENLEGKIQELSEKYESETDKLFEHYEAEKERAEKLEEKLTKVQEELDSISEVKEAMSQKYNEMAMNYYSMVYKIDKGRVQQLMETSTSESELKTLLEKEQKLLRRKAVTESSDHYIPEYNPTRTDKKAKFLESLVK